MFAVTLRDHTEHTRHSSEMAFILPFADKEPETQTWPLSKVQQVNDSHFLGQPCLTVLFDELLHFRVLYTRKTWKF